MAQRAESLNPDPTVPATVVPMPEPTRTDGGTLNQVLNTARDTYDEVARKAGDAASEIASKASDVYDDVAERVARVSTQARQRVATMANDVGTQLRRTRQENPMIFVAVAAGVGFLAGVLLRVWRSSRYE